MCDIPIDWLPYHCEGVPLNSIQEYICRVRGTDGLCPGGEVVLAGWELASDARFPLHRAHQGQFSPTAQDKSMSPRHYSGRFTRREYCFDVRTV